jgi:hypothetical protein
MPVHRLMRHFAATGLKINLIVMSIVILAGCASMSPEACRTANWYNLGARDAKNGEPSSIIADYRRACAKADVVADGALYLLGHADGQREYCTEENGYSLGRKGKMYQYACEGERSNLFMRGYEPGLALYKAHEAASIAEGEIEYYSKEVTNARESLALERAAIKMGSQAFSGEGAEKNRKRLERYLSFAETSLWRAKERYVAALKEIGRLEQPAEPAAEASKN